MSGDGTFYPTKQGSVWSIEGGESKINFTRNQRLEGWCSEIYNDTYMLCSIEAN